MHLLRRLAARPLLLDALLAAALVCLAEIHVWRGAPGSKAVTAPAALVIAGAVAWRRRAPLAAAAAAGAAIVVQSVLASSPQALWLIMTVAILAYSVGSALPLAQAAAGGGILLAALAVDELYADDRSVSGFVFVALLVTLPWLAGRAVHARQQSAELLDLRAARLEREREEDTRAAVAAERTRIARELHDMVAHAISVMVVKAEAADAVLDDRPGAAHEQLASVQSMGRQAVAEMSRLVGMLREAGSVADLAPQPGLDRLGSLADELRAAGLTVELALEGETRPLAPGVDLAAYRIVQEALTNVLKHAGPNASARVLVRYGRNELAVEVRDDGRGLVANGSRRGHGLVGLRERVALYGGSLHVGARNEGGFEVRARLPLEPDPR